MCLLGVLTHDRLDGESRVSPRVGLEIPITLRQFNWTSGITAQISDISRDGLGLKLPDTRAKQKISIGDFLAFETSEEFFKIKGVGQIAWIHPVEPRVGIAIIDLEGTKADLLEQFLLLCM
jgi:hypothetical protein